ncbi:MAG: succinylglutamate desuccinylase/aspartoacylase family protein [Lachnospiraceae bacterium]|nr:succinylglutamate desuccinylase/aspartoacylase family protein [Lachnospiraceae bacterium]
MKEEILYEIKGLYRDDFRVKGYRFGGGENSVCIMGSMRGNEFQQIYVCSQLIQKLKQLEEKGKIVDGEGILVIPCGNPYSVNVKKRFWTIDNTDINRMYPGYSLGETTQRIAAGIFEQIKDYRYGIQFASFYMPGNFVPQVRVMKTGMENIELAKQFGLPYVVLHHPRPFDTTTLNYNWQIWETDAFSIYTTSTSAVDKESAKQAVDAVLNFLSKQGIIQHRGYEGFISRVVESHDFVNVRTAFAGFFEKIAEAGERVDKGQILAKIVDPYTGDVRQEIVSPIEGIIAFAHNESMAYQNTAVYKLIAEENEA